MGEAKVRSWNYRSAIERFRWIRIILQVVLNEQEEKDKVEEEEEEMRMKRRRLDSSGQEHGSGSDESQGETKR